MRRACIWYSQGYAGKAAAFKNHIRTFMHVTTVSRFEHYVNKAADTHDEVFAIASPGVSLAGIPCFTRKNVVTFQNQILPLTLLLRMALLCGLRIRPLVGNVLSSRGSYGQNHLINDTLWLNTNTWKSRYVLDSRKTDKLYTVYAFNGEVMPPVFAFHAAPEEIIKDSRRLSACLTEEFQLGLVELQYAVSEDGLHELLTVNSDPPEDQLRTTWFSEQILKIIRKPHAGGKT